MLGALVTKKIITLALIVLSSASLLVSARDTSSFSEEKRTQNMPTVTTSSTETSGPSSSQSTQKSTLPRQTSEKSDNNRRQTTTSTKAASLSATLNLNGMTWQKNTATGSDVNIGVAYQSKSDVIFNWQYYDISNKKWVTINSNTASNWITFKAPHAGDYLIHVYGTTTEGETKEYVIGWTVEPETVNLKGMTWQILEKNASKANVGVAYTSNSKLTFTWQYYDITKKEWQIVAKDTTSNWMTFALPHTGEYLIHVESRTESGKTATYTIGWQVAAETVNLKGMTWQIMANDLTNSNFGMAYETNTSLTYNWQYYDVSRKAWYTIIDQTPSNWVTFSAPHVGQYLIRVEAKTPNGLTKEYVMGWDEKSRHQVISDGTILGNDSQKTSKLIAHRGNSSSAPENTTAAFALAKGAYGVETDILLTKDHHWVISHDSTVDRMTNGSGKISDLTLAQIKNLRIDNGVNIQNFPGLKIATLEEYLTIMNQIGTRPVIEIKEGPDRITPSDIENLLHALSTYNLTDQALIISFYLDDLKLIYQQNQTLEMSLLYAGNFTKVQFDALIKEMPNTGLDINDALISPEVSNLLHENGRKVGIWTTPLRLVNRYLNLGIDYFTTDHLK